MNGNGRISDQPPFEFWNSSQKFELELNLVTTHLQPSGLNIV